MVEPGVLAGGADAGGIVVQGIAPGGTEETGGEREDTGARPEIEGLPTEPVRLAAKSVTMRRQVAVVA